MRQLFDVVATIAAGAAVLASRHAPARNVPGSDACSRRGLPPLAIWMIFSPGPLKGGY